MRFPIPEGKSVFSQKLSFEKKSVFTVVSGTSLHSESVLPRTVMRYVEDDARGGLG